MKVRSQKSEVGSEMRLALSAVFTFAFCVLSSDFAAGQLMAPAKEAAVRAMFPVVDDAEIAAVLADPLTLLYTDAEMPPAYQAWQEALAGVHSPRHNIAANPDPHGNANVEFPWGRPAGTHASPGTKEIVFVWLPPSAAGPRWPVVWWRDYIPGDSHPAVQWIFPVGTIVGEVLCMTGPSGRDYAYEVRVRRREPNYWEVGVYRPFASRAEVAERLRAVAPDETALVAEFARPGLLRRMALAERQPRRAIFRQTAAVDTIPSMPEETVWRLLTSTPFAEVTGRPWAEDADGTPAHAPTSDGFSIVPAGYTAGFMAVETTSCARCHDNTLRHAEEFADNGRERDWYGRVRGSDGIFSFHPFEPSSISYSGANLPVLLRKGLHDAGLLDQYDAEKHPADRYQVVPSLDTRQYPDARNGITIRG